MAMSKQTSNADGPLHGTDQRLILLNTFIVQEFGSVNLRVIITIKQGGCLGQWVLVEYLLV
jgi:hypothetical protein